MSSLYLLLNAITSMGSHQEKPAYIACLCLHLRTFDYTLLGLVTRPYLWALLLGLTRGGQSGGAGGAQATPGILIFQKQVTPCHQIR